MTVDHRAMAEQLLAAAERAYDQAYERSGPPKEVKIQLAHVHALLAGPPPTPRDQVWDALERKISGGA